MSEKDDHELVREVLQGNISSFEVLVGRYQTKIYGMILQMTADPDTSKDLAQEIFLKAYLNLKGFQFRFRFFSWLYRIALNETINFMKSRKRFQPLDQELSVAVEEEECTATTESQQQLRKALRNLRTDYRLLILLKYWFGLSYEEIAETLGISVTKVRNRMFYARLTLREKLQTYDYFGHD